MEIIKARPEHSSGISELMLEELKEPDNRFPEEMIARFREHAKEGSILSEFENPHLIAFVSMNESVVSGFIVGYGNPEENNAMIHYIVCDNPGLKKNLLNSFIDECKARHIKKIVTDTFEFFQNNEFFRTNGFTFVKKEPITPDLEMLWYELPLN